MSKEVAVTIRVPRELKQEIERVSADLGVSQSAVWKILISRYVRPVAQSGLELAVANATEEAALPLFGGTERASTTRSLPASPPARSGVQ